MFSNQFTDRYRQLGFNAKDIQLQESLRVNTLKISEEKLIERLKQRGVLLEKVQFLQHAYWVKKARFSISALQEHLQGYFYIQEAAAQVPAEVLNPNKNDIVLDCCAAPGGKTTQMALMAKAVVAVESQHNRMPALVNNIERMGIKNIITVNADARTFEPEIKFNKILVDAPCSGNYVIDPHWSTQRSIANIERNSSIQKEILSNVINCLSDDGELVYSTCSLEPEEDEMIIDWAIKELRMKVVEIKCIGEKGIQNPFGIELDKNVEKARRIWPGRTQGFFIAKLRF